MLASPEYRHRTGAGRNEATPRIARKRPTPHPRSVHPTTSFGFLVQGRAHLDRQANQVDKAQRVLLVVTGAHGEAGDIPRVERIRRFAALRVDIALVEAQFDLAGDRLRNFIEEGVERLA